MLLLPAVIVILTYYVALRVVTPAARPWAAIAGWLVMPAVIERAHPRPDLVGLLGLALLTWLLHRERSARPWDALAAGVATLLWVQLHASFLVAALVLAPALVEACVRKDARGIRVASAGVAGLVAGVLVAVLCQGPGLLMTVLGQLERTESVALIQEWQAPKLTSVSRGLLLLTLPGALAAFLWSSRPRSWSLLANTAILVYAAFGASRFVAIAGLGLMLFLARHAPVAAAPPRLVLLVVVLVLLGYSRDPLAIPGVTPPSVTVPEAVLSALERLPARPDGERLRVYSWFDLGGLLSFRMGDRVTVSLDARAELAYPPALRDSLTLAFSNPEAWASAWQAWAPDAVLTPREAPLCQGLAATPGWWPLAEEGGWVLLARSMRSEPLYYPCLSIAERVRRCRAEPDRAAARELVDRVAVRVDAGGAMLAGALTFGCLGESDRALELLDLAAVRDPRDAAVHEARWRVRQAMGQARVRDAWWLAWFAPARLAAAEGH